MPVCNLLCKYCNHEYKDLIKTQSEAVCPKCGAVDNQYVHLPKGSSTMVMETKDKGRGKQLKKGIEKQLKSRMKKHHDQYEVEEKIDKHGLDDAVKHGWTKDAKKV